MVFNGKCSRKILLHICIYIYIYIYGLYLYVCVCMHTYIHIYIYMLCVCVCVCVWVGVRVCVWERERERVVASSKFLIFPILHRPRHLQSSPRQNVTPLHLPSSIRTSRKILSEVLVGVWPIRRIAVFPSRLRAHDSCVVFVRKLHPDPDTFVPPHHPPLLLPSSYLPLEHRRSIMFTIPPLGLAKS